MFATSKSADAVYLAGGDGVADAIDFDGTNDYLSRSSDLVGNSDGKTFTFSCWVWWNGADSLQLYGNADGFVSFYLNAGGLTIVASSSAGGTGLAATTRTNQIPKNTFTNVLCSVDLNNSANRSIYVNDVSVVVSWSTYRNTSIDWTRTSHAVTALPDGTQKLNGRLSSFYLDYTYRDLSIEANRRIFVLP